MPLYRRFAFVVTAIVSARADDCITLSSWDGSGSCLPCPGSVQDGQCTDWSWNRCYASVSECQKAFSLTVDAPEPLPPNVDPDEGATNGSGSNGSGSNGNGSNGNGSNGSGSNGSNGSCVRPTAPPVSGGDNLPPPNSGTPNIPPNTPEPPSSNTTPPSVDNGGDKSCWAATSWQTAECAPCTGGVQSGQCKPHWTPCFSSEAACVADASARTGGNSGGGNTDGGSTGGGTTGGNSGGCTASCPDNTLSMKRPSFLGPNCYDSQYGTGFGPNWKPSGKTRFEKFFPSPSDFERFVWISSTDSPPVLNLTWKVSGCQGAAAVYENMVCAIEYLQQRRKKFDPTPASPGYTVDDFLNSGDEMSDKLELATFFAHKFKETARLTIWEEMPGNSYAVPDTNYPPVEGQSYRGRGPVQISYNFNYGPFSEWLFGDKNVLLRNPGMVDSEGPMGFIAALWFWMTPRDFSSGQPLSGSLRTRDAVIHWTDGKINAMYNDGKDYDKYAGLGLTTNVINGGVECGARSDTSPWRVSYFLTAASKLGIKFDNLEDPVACANDKLCHGLFSGCTGTVGLKCQASPGLCSGDTFYYNGWTRGCN